MKKEKARLRGRALPTQYRIPGRRPIGRQGFFGGARTSTRSARLATPHANGAGEVRVDKAPPIRPALFDGRHVRRQLSGNDLLGVMMEAAAQRDGRRNDGKGKDDAHDISLYWHFHSILGTRDFVHLTASRLEKR